MGLFMPLEEDDTVEIDNIQVEGIDCATWEKDEIGLLKVPYKHRYEVLC